MKKRFFFLQIVKFIKCHAECDVFKCLVLDQQKGPNPKKYSVGNDVEQIKSKPFSLKN